MTSAIVSDYVIASLMYTTTHLVCVFLRSYQLILFDALGG
ncbi:hypothetical protein LINPERHAP1_LOCUS5756, partial [Linum perenne]